MKQLISILSALALVLAPLPPPVYAQQLNQNAAGLSASSSACATVSSCVALQLGLTDRSAAITINGTFVGTETFEASNSNGSQWSSISCTTWNYGAAVSSATAVGSWVCDAAGKTNIRVRQSAWTSGAALVSLSSSTADAQAVNVTGTTYNGVAKNIVTAADFTTSGVGTASEAITGLSFTLPANTPISVPLHCGGTYLQNTGNAAVTFAVGFSQAPTNAQFEGIMETAVTAVGVLGGTAITSATTGAIVTATPGATATNYYASFDGYIENPSGSANVVTFYARTATAGDTVTVRRGFYCSLLF